VAKWPNRDPIGIQGGVNLYTFVNNNPISALDPIGSFVEFMPRPILRFFIRLAPRVVPRQGPMPPTTKNPKLEKKWYKVKCEFVKYSVGDPEHLGQCTYHCVGEPGSGIDYYVTFQEDPEHGCQGFEFEMDEDGNKKA
jgi:hypothetical protein